MTSVDKLKDMSFYQKDRLNLLYGNNIAGLIVTFIASAFLVFYFRESQLNAFKINWFVLFSCVLLLRFADVLWWKIAHKTEHYNYTTAFVRFTLGNIVTALLWCTYSLMTYQNASTIEVTANAMIVSAMAGGAASALSGHKTLSFLYSFILLVPFAMALFLSNNHYQEAIGGLGFMLSFILLTISNKSADFTFAAIELKHQNALLVNHMEEQVELRTHEIYELSNIDSLTRLFNRDAFLKHLQEMLDDCVKTKESLALLFIDLDGFKKINDSLGHDIGDHVLSQTAIRLMQEVTDDFLLCRWGGDEFLIAAKNKSRLDIVEYANNLIKNIHQPYLVENNHLSIGATIGVSFYPEDTHDKYKLIELADTAMYFQKKTEPSHVKLFSKQLGLQLQREQLLKDGLSQAIENNELRLVYQPIISSVSGKIIAFEALLRWQHGDENISPDEFITIAEQYGLIRKIGSWVLKEACHAVKLWNQNGVAISVSINVSVIQLQDENFVEFVQKTLAEQQIPSELIHIEITETVFIEDTQRLFKHIKKLQKNGIKVSIDDFGTGFSSLSVMQNMSVNIVKIDRSFVDNIATSGLVIIEAVMQISNTLDYKVVAEGVETHEQATQLANMGVHFLQGFYFKKPMELNDVKLLLRESDSLLISL